MTEHKDDWLRPDEVAPIVRRSTKTLSNWRSARKGPPAYHYGQEVVYRRSEVEKWLDESLVLIEDEDRRGRKAS